MNKQSKVLAVGFVVCTTLLACNGGGNNNSSLPATPNTQNQLQKYLSLWSYTPLAVNNNNKSLSSTIGNQLYMVESKDNSVTSMSLTFYSDSACTTALNTITFNGPTSVLAGTYHTTDQSNFYACNTIYSGGCVAELNANSSQYKYTFANGAFSYSYCLTNPATSGDKIADWSSGSAVSCSAGSNCGYSQPYTFALFPSVYWAKQVGAATGTTQSNSVAIDMLGNSYITGYTTLGISEQTQTGFGDYFIAKYTESGTLLWTKQVRAADGSTQGNSIATDTTGNLYITGFTTRGISGQTQTGSQDYFIAKYTESSTLLLWTKQVGLQVAQLKEKELPSILQVIYTSLVIRLEGFQDKLKQVLMITLLLNTPRVVSCYGLGRLELQVVLLWNKELLPMLQVIHTSLVIRLEGFPDRPRLVLMIILLLNTARVVSCYGLNKLELKALQPRQLVLLPTPQAIRTSLVIRMEEFPGRLRLALMIASLLNTARVVRYHRLNKSARLLEVLMEKVLQLM